MNADEQGGRKPILYREMTVAHIREPKGADYVEVVFLESARFYKLSAKNPAYAEALRLLREALAKKRVVNVGFVSLDSDTIEEIQGA